MTDFPAAKKSPFAKILIGCGCFFLVALISLVVAGFNYVPKIVKTTPADIEAMYSQMVFDTEVPVGFTGELGMDWSEMPFVGTDVLIAVLVSDDRAYRINVMMMPEDSAARGKVRLTTDGSGITTRKSVEMGTRTVAGQTVELLDVEIEDQEGMRWHACQLQFPVRDGKAMIIMFQGPEKNFDVTRFESYFMSLPGAVAATESPPEKNDAPKKPEGK